MPERNERELLVMRHAKSAWDTDALTDRERPLNARGERDAPFMGRWLAEHDALPDLVVVSPARRALRTAEALLAAGGKPSTPTITDERVYDAVPDDLLDVLAELAGDVRRVLLVGHNPGVEGLVRHLAGSQARVPANGKLMPTAALARFRMPEDWGHLAAGAGRLVTIGRPKELRS